ncbi:MAG TPA: cysteine--tRNA ligase [Candidatus Dormibacteraeota bacterium]|nr:cysteine--tRNA ligase [Candidatus Dormibacteraeota bacterium]
MTIRLRNTLTRTDEPLEPGPSGRIAMYSCGPTVYRYAHVGNLRTFLLPDLIRRTLLYHGIEVVHVQNITDVGHMRDERFDRGEDRMLVAAGLENKTPAQIADAYETAFHADEALVNILPAHVFPRATEHIPEMIELAERLVDAGYAYVSDHGNIYYAVASFPDYGRLSGNSLDELRAGHRGHVDHDKRDPADFALWKAAGEGRMLKWPTPRWGDGFPGWHLECSAMALRHLGPRFDIHTGGIDNVFPHHEDEIAQSAPLVGGPPARLWVHGAFLQVGGQKMAKSAGNIERVSDLSDRGIDPLAFRYLCLTSRYRHKLEYTAASLAAAAAGLESLRAGLRALGPPPVDGPWRAPVVIRAGRAPDRPVGTVEGLAGHGGSAGDPAASEQLSDRATSPAAPLSAAGRELHDRFVAAIDDDLDMPTALAVTREVLRAPLGEDERRWLILDADAVLGLDLDRAWESGPSAVAPGDVEALLADRTAARVAGDYGRADSIRADLADRGWEIVDGPGRSTLRPISRR